MEMWTKISKASHVPLLARACLCIQGRKGTGLKAYLELCKSFLLSFFDEDNHIFLHVELRHCFPINLLKYRCFTTSIALD